MRATGVGAGAGAGVGAGDSQQSIMSTREEEGGGGGGQTVHHHHASIELAEKIIDSPQRLVDTLAHEFCHLANFMVGAVTERPHGREFRGW